MNKRIAVIGAGITGVLAAYYLAKSGNRVTILEQESYPAMRTSYANGGQVSVSNSEVWTTWSNVRKGFKWMFQKDAPLLIRPAPSWAKIKWMTRFLLHTFAGDYARNTAETIRLGIESRDLYKEIIQEEGLEFDQSYCGILHFYKDEKYLQDAVSVKELYNANKCEWNILTPLQTQSMDPALSDIEDIAGGVWTPSDWTGDIHKFCTELSSILKEKYKVDFIFDTKVDKFTVDEMLEEFDNVIISAGVGSVEIAKYFGDRLSVYPVKGYSITINVKPEDMKYVPKVSLLDDQAKIVTSTLGNRFRVAGTAELTGENYDIRKDRVEPLIRWVRENFPNLDASDYSSWACLRPMTPNMMPIVKQGKNPNVFYHTGHGHLGWTLSPATAKQLVELIKHADDR
jgi:D-amino-acid dehydrogenase